jgi:proline iminopeptidase
MFVKVNDVDLFVNIQGDGPPIIAHHGGPGLGSHANDKAAFAPLSDAYKIVSFDARGSGRSGAVPPYTHEQWVADVDALRAHFGFERFIMTGGSYGGYIALEYTLAHPGRVSHLILRDTAASHAYEEQAKATAMARAAEFPGIDRHDLDRIFAGQMEDDDDFKRVFTNIAPLYNANYDAERTARWVNNIIFRADTHNKAFSQNIPGFDLTARLGEVQVPTLVIVGRHDWITPVEASEEIAAGIPNAELVIFENSGHSPQQEEHGRFVAVVRDFLQRHKSQLR